MPFSASQMHETLDENGWLDDSHGSGVYALRLADPPDDPRAVFEAWTKHFDAVPAWLTDGLADAERLSYVGASGDVYDRLMDHAEATVRRVAVMRPFPPVDVLGVEAADEPFEAEYNYARRWVENGYDVWCDGALL